MPHNKEDAEIKQQNKNKLSGALSKKESKKYCRLSHIYRFIIKQSKKEGLKYAIFWDIYFPETNRFLCKSCQKVFQTYLT